METEFKDKMSDLTTQLEQERKKKADLDRELQSVTNELENIETRFPDELSELKS